MKECEALKGPHVVFNDNERLQQELRREGLLQICDAAEAIASLRVASSEPKKGAECCIRVTEFFVKFCIL
jgi:hypothetical protein